MAEPAGFSSPMGGRMGKRASAAAASDLAELASLSKKYRENMEGAAKAAERAAGASGKAGSHYASNLLGVGTPATGGATANGGGAAIPNASGSHWINQHQPGSPFPMIGGRPEGFAGGMGAQLGAPKPNGGGANIPTPAEARAARVQARAAQIGEEREARQIANNNGGIAGGMGRIMGQGLGKAFGAAVGGFVAATDTYRDYDYLANRIAMNSTSPYSKRAGAMTIRNQFGGAYRNTEELAAQVGALQSGGYTTNSAGYATQASTIRSIATLDPNLARSAGQIATGFQSPTQYNTARMFGVQTMGPHGTPRSVNDIARDLYRRSVTAAGHDASRPGSEGNIAAMFGPGGSLSTTMDVWGMSGEQQQAIRNSLTASAKAGHFVTDRETQGRNKKNPFSDTMLGADQNRTGAEAKFITAGLKEFADGYTATQKVLAKSTEALASTMDHAGSVIRHAIYGLGGAGGSITQGGGKVSNAIGGGIAFGVGGAIVHGGSALAMRAWRASRGGARTVGSAAEDVGPALGEAGGALGTVGRFGGRALGALGAAFALNDIRKEIGFGLTHHGRAPKSNGAWWQFWKGNEATGDGPGRPAIGSASWGGVGAGTFRGQEWGDGVADAAKRRGGETVDALEEMLKGIGPGYRITSTKRSGKAGVTVSGNVSYHATGNAIDITGPSPSVDSPELLAINKYLAQYAPGINELIYAGPGGVLIKDGKRVDASRYGKAVMDIHHNHVHLAATSSMLKRLKGKKGILGKIKDTAGGILGSIVGGAKNIARGVGKALGVGGSHGNGTGTGNALGRLGLSAGALGRQSSQADLLRDLLDVGASTGPTVADPDESSIGGRGATKDNGTAQSHDNGGSSGGGGSAKSMPEGDAMSNARTIIRVAKEMGISKRGAIIGIATAEQESNLINLHSGDRDSQGLFQQRPSQGWGSVAEVTNPEHAARSFFSRLKGLDYEHLPVTVAAQKVQRSAYPNAYAKWEKTATQIVNQTHEYGDGLGAAGGAGLAMAQTVETPDMPASHGVRGSSGNLTVHSRGGSSMTIGKVEVHLHNVDRVSQTEAKRIGRMVVEEIAREARHKEMSR